MSNRDAPYDQQLDAISPSVASQLGLAHAAWLTQRCRLVPGNLGPSTPSSVRSTLLYFVPCPDIAHLGTVGEHRLVRCRPEQRKPPCSRPQICQAPDAVSLSMTGPPQRQTPLLLQIEGPDLSRQKPDAHVRHRKPPRLLLSSPAHHTQRQRQHKPPRGVCQQPKRNRIDYPASVLGGYRPSIWLPSGRWPRVTRPCNSDWIVWNFGSG